MIRWTCSILCLLIVHVLPLAASPVSPRVIVIDIDKPQGPSSPCVGFLGGLRDTTPDALVAPLHPTLFRIGHQFRGRFAGGLPAAIARVEKFGATYKLVMSDLINSHPKDYAIYEAEVAKLVAQTGDAAASIIWEPANEPDEGYKPIEGYYELYAHAFKALRLANSRLQVCGPSFAFPSYDKYKAFLDYCRANHLDCNDLSWHYTGWDPAAPIHQKWHLEKLRSLLTEYPEQHIREVHCDEWGAGPQKPSAENPGRLQPGRAVVWFHYLEDVYQVDRACRANWGGADDYLGGIITEDNQPYPAYYAYRWFGAMAGQERLPVEGNDARVAALASRSKASGQVQVLLGSIAAGQQPIELQLHGLPGASADISIERLPTTNLDKPLTEADLPAAAHFHHEITGNSISIKLDPLTENEACRVVITWK